MRNELNRKISLRDFQIQTGDGEQEWLKISETKALLEEMRSQILDEKFCSKQAKRLEPEVGQEIKNLRRVYMKFFTTSKLGLGTCTGKRDSSDQNNFRASLLKVSNSKHHDPDRMAI